MPARIPHPSSDVEVRQAFQRIAASSDILTAGASGEILVGAGVGLYPVWGTELTALTKVTVDNITIDAAAIVSDTGAISFSNENLTTTGTIAGVNVTSGADPGHTHTGASLSGIDISADTNLAVSAPIVLTGDTLSLDQSAIDHGSIGGLEGDDHTQYLLADGTRTLTNSMAVTALKTIDGRDLSVDGAKLDGIEALADVTDATNVAAAGAAMSGGAFHDGFSDFVAAEHVSLPNTIANILSDHDLAAHTALGLFDASSDVDHDATTNFVANEHIDWTNAAVAFVTSSTIAGINVTSGSNPGHTHTGGVSGIDTVTELTNNGAMHGAICHVVYSDGDGTFDFVDVTDSDKSNAIGLLTETITMGNTGFVRVGGVLSAAKGFWNAVSHDTGGDGLVSGSFYYACPVTPGWITKTKPTDPAYRVVRLGVALSTTDLSIDIQEAAPVLELVDTNLTIYVTTTGSDATGLGIVSNPYATLSKALDILSTKVIASNVTVTIQLGNGTYTSASPVNLVHPNGDRIAITGENTYAINMTSIQSSSGAAGAWAIVLNVSSVANCAVGDYILVPRGPTGGTRPRMMGGCHKITNVDVPNTRITVTNKNLSGTAPSGAVAASIVVVKTILQFNGCHGIVFSGGTKLGAIAKCVIAGSGTPSTYGIELPSLNDCVATGTTFGMTSFDTLVKISFKAVFRGNYGHYSGGVSYGFFIVDGTHYCNFSVISGCAYGIYNIQGNLAFQSSLVCGCTSGIFAIINASILCDSTTIAYNTGTGTTAMYNTFLFADSSTYLTNGTDSSPVVNTLGNTESYIKN